MEMPKPSDHHKKLQKLAGQWKGEEKMYPSEWDPKGSVAQGTNAAHVALDGFAVVSDYHQEKNGQVTYMGHAVWTYDAKQSCYVLHWFDSMGSPAEVFKGSFENDVLTVSHGGPMHARLTYDFSNARQLKTRMEMSQDGQTWNKFFDGTYDKK